MTAEEEAIAKVFTRYKLVYDRVNTLQRLIEAGNATRADKRLLQFEQMDLIRYKRMYKERKKRQDAKNARKN